MFRDSGSFYRGSSLKEEKQDVHERTYSSRGTCCPPQNFFGCRSDGKEKHFIQPAGNLTLLT